VLIAALSLLVVGAPAPAQIRRASDAPQPHSPEASASFFRLPPGFRIEIVASEPWIADPTAIAFDAAGRIIVCELHGYNLDGHYDIQELNKAGVLDEQVRRIPANRAAIERAESETHGTVKLLEDRDGDGRVDAATVWANDLPAAYGVVAARGGAIVTCAPDIVFLADRDGDGTAEVRETLFTGFSAGELWTRISNPRLGPDNWIYVASGHGSGGTIRGPRLDRAVRIGNTDFRFRADGSAIEPVTGGTGGFGLALTDFGDRFLINNSNHARYAIPLPHRLLARNPFAPAPRSVENAAGYTDVYPASEPHPWRLARSRIPAWVRFYGAHETKANGNFTAICGQLVYRGAAFPPAFRGNHFSCESQQNLIHRCLVERDGAGYRVRRAPGEEKIEFLTSTEGWFRPVNLTLGPDGALYVVDMYREIIEDYSAIPRFLQQQYGLITGADRGRIWRVVHDSAPSSRSADLASQSSTELAATLASNNAWRRQTAQRLLIERRAVDAAEGVRSILRWSASDAARLHALYTLDGLDRIESTDLLRGLRDVHHGVRTHGLRLAASRLDAHDELLDAAVAMVDDPDPAVRLSVAMALGESRSDAAFEALSRLASRHGAERWMAAAILSSTRDSSGRLLCALLNESDMAANRGSLVESLARVVGARRDDAEIGLVLETVAALSGSGASASQERALDGLLSGLAHGTIDALESAVGQKALVRLLGHPAAAVRVPAFQLFRVLKVAGSPASATAFERAATIARDATRDIDERTAALEILGGAPLDVLGETTAELLEPRQPLAVQLAAIRALARSNDQRVGALLLDGWTAFSPTVQTAALDAVFARADRLSALLDAIEGATVAPSHVRGIRRVQLLENADAAMRRRARALLGGPTVAPAREETLREYLAVVRAGAGDAERGAAVFKEVCANCHLVRGEGREVGPDLSSARSRADEVLLRDLLAPSDQITIGFRSYVVVTQGGAVLTGTLASEGATSVTLKKEGGEATTVLRREILSMRASDVSLMPDNLVDLVKPRDAADVIAFLRSAFGAFDPSGFVLFDDEREFVATLVEGSGTAKLSSADRYSGEFSLAVTPPQRYSGRIAGWSHRIVETPDEGSFRYLRFAWKSSGADGVMIELAADGGWPAAEQPERRYYAGKNTTSWQAKRVSSEPPENWTVVTVDLWKDCGTFTLTGIAPTAMGGTALFDRIELLRTVSD